MLTFTPTVSLTDRNEKRMRIEQIKKFDSTIQWWKGEKNNCCSFEIFGREWSEVSSSLILFNAHARYPFYQKGYLYRLLPFYCDANKHFISLQLPNWTMVQLVKRCTSVGGCSLSMKGEKRTHLFKVGKHHWSYSLLNGRQRNVSQSQSIKSVWIFQ